MKKLVVLGIFACAFVAVSAFAQQNKVVVVPMGSASKMTAAAAGGDQTLAVNTTTQTARSVTITVPTDGIIIVNASCYVESASPAGTNVFFRAFITTGSGIDFDAMLAYADDTTSGSLGTVSGTRAFAVTAGTYTYNLNVNMWTGLATLRDSNINALFVPVTNPVISTAPISAPAVSPTCEEGSSPHC